MIWWIWLLVAGYLLLTAFVIWQMSYWVKKARTKGHIGKFKWLIPVVSILSCFPILGTFLPESLTSAFFMKYGNLWIGIIGAFGIVMFFALISKIFVKPITAKYANGVLVFMLIFALAVNAYGMIHAQNVTTKEYTVELSADGAKQITDETYNTSGKDVVRVAFISDVHMGVNTNLNHIQEMVDTINENDVDIVLGGGDYFTSSYVGLKETKAAAEILKGIKSKDGGYYALGNHDVTEKLFCGFAITPAYRAFRYPEMESFFTAAGWNIKQDKVVEINGIQYVFRKDAEKTGDGKNKRKSVEEIMAETDPTKPVLVIEHEPDELQELADAGADIVLSGHTHDGQIFPGNIYGRIDAAKNNSNSYGAKQYDNELSITSSGVGYFGPPIRIGTDSEVVILNLVLK